MVPSKETPNLNNYIFNEAQEIKEKNEPVNLLLFDESGVKLSSIVHQGKETHF